LQEVTQKSQRSANDQHGRQKNLMSHFLPP
jgi:hypothetical protein